MDERSKLEQAIQALEAQRSILGDAAVDTSIFILREKLKSLTPPPAQQSRKQVTVMFADLSGYTGLSESMDAEDVANLVNRLWDRLDAIIIHYGGRIDKHAGDGVMALWGAEAVREDDPERAVRAALEMQKAVSVLAEERHYQLKMRIGLHTGPVMLGEIGSQREFTAMGDTVNVAARLEQSAPPGGILTSQDTFRHISGIFETIEQPLATFKGKQEALQTYLIKGVRPRSFRNVTRGVDGIETHMIGRDAELHLLQRRFRAVRHENVLRVALIMGDAGLGKSRLLFEFEQWIEGSLSAFTMIKARAEEQSRALPFGLLRELLSSRFGISESTSLPEARQRIETGVTAILGAESIDKAHFIGHLLGFDFPDSPYLSGIQDISLLQKQAFFYIQQYFSSLSWQAPLVLYFDDLHWADDASREWLDGLIAQCADMPIFIICASRPTLFEENPNWEPAWKTDAIIKLTPLSREHSRILIHEILLKATNVPQNFQELLLNNAEGNPFYLEELIKMLIEAGIVIKGAETWQVDAAKLEQLKVPSTLAGILQARLDGLPPSERTLLQRAAVVGRVFWDDAIAAMHSENGEQVRVQRDLASLSSRELVFPLNKSSFEGTQEFLFKHGILRDVTYEQVLKNLRKIYHLQAAQWLVEKSGERANQFAAVIANHFELAGADKEAGDWYLKAARAAQESYSAEPALRYFEKGLALMGERAPYEERFNAHLNMGELCVLLGRYTESMQFYDQALSLAEAQGDSTGQARTLSGIGMYYSHTGQYASALDVARRAEQAARAISEPEPGVLAQAVWQQAIILFRFGRLEEASAIGHANLDYCREHAIRPQEASTYNLLGLINTSLGQFREGIAWGEKSLEIWRSLNHRPFEAALLSNIGEDYRLMGDNARAAEYYKQALAISEDIGELDNVSGYLLNLAHTRIGLGDPQDALELLKRARLTSHLESYNEPEIAGAMAQVQLMLGNLPVALEESRKQAALAAQFQDSDQQVYAWQVAGQVLSMLGSVAEIVPGESMSARQCFERGLSMARENKKARDEAVMLWRWAEHELARGDKSLGERLWNDARQNLLSQNLNLLVEQMDSQCMQK